MPSMIWIFKSGLVGKADLSTQFEILPRNFLRAHLESTRLSKVVKGIASWTYGRTDEVRVCYLSDWTVKLYVKLHWVCYFRKFNLMIFRRFIYFIELRFELTLQKLRNPNQTYLEWDEGPVLQKSKVVDCSCSCCCIKEQSTICYCRDYSKKY